MALLLLQNEAFAAGTPERTRIGTEAGTGPSHGTTGGPLGSGYGMEIGAEEVSGLSHSYCCRLVYLLWPSICGWYTIATDNDLGALSSGRPLPPTGLLC